MVEFSSYKRNTIIEAIKQENLDILVVGGGITGAGIALDATTRGLNVAVIEMQDFAAGTSSKSTKLVHGGLRYLQQFEIKLVAEVGKERAIVYENGPHVTKPEWMMLPFHKGGNFGPLSTSVGLKVYDFLAGVKKGERRQMLNPKEAINKEPLINQNDLKGAGYYVEYKTDDARLTIEVLKKAIEQGAHAVNYMKAVNLLYDESGKVCGIKTHDEISGELHEIHAKKIVSATGPWLDELREIDHSKKGKTLHLTKGVHLVFSQKDFPLKQAIYFDSPDGRMIFAIPRQKKVYVGTTDTYYKADVIDPKTTVEDRDYVINTINSMFPSLRINKDHVESSWAGVRALFSDGNDEKPGEISRKDEIFISESGLISMAGGKLTGYRKMAEEAVNTVLKELKHEDLLYDAPSQTRHLPISGGDVGGSEGFKIFKQEKLKEGMDLGLSKDTVTRLIDLYGSNISILFNIYQESIENEADIDPLVLAELKYGLNYELVYKPVDFFVRRTSALFFDIDWVKQHKQAVINYMAYH
ncbi:Glycerol-3-phosphate dehydrogenase [Lentibacillus sp. JNUCC-1]|uniref:glycerol-3-phosphate dehydrogenase/oxidase n=1 Tax=Lentibacillus sp. JNUCC-1 TaxID=2654513 RepID=UPI0013273B40|nr:Glycerol-3-phosphate dehydrogenase [Lentibacillus sp. JNUCC-1]